MNQHKPLQQQPRRPVFAQQQQQSGSGEFGKQQQMGEGSYEGTRDYDQRTQDYLKKHDVQKDAEAAKPRSAEEARDLEQAEAEGRSHSKGEDTTGEDTP